MDAAPTPTELRLERAEKLVGQAAARSAEVAVLPEVFNTGYEYHDRNYAMAEPIGGQTVSWLKSAARKYNLYLAGSLLLRESDGIYNTIAAGRAGWQDLALRQIPSLVLGTRLFQATQTPAHPG